MGAKVFVAHQIQLALLSALKPNCRVGKQLRKTYLIPKLSLTHSETLSKPSSPALGPVSLSVAPDKEVESPKKVQYRDSLRAVYFIDLVKETQASLIRLTAQFTEQPVEAVSPVIEWLVDQGDMIVLGVLPAEVRQARINGLLHGRTSLARYQSFFFNDQGWTPMSRNLKIKYPRLRYLLELLFRNTTANIQEMLNRFQEDLARGCLRSLFYSDTEQIQEIQILNGDPHNNGRIPLLIVFKSGLRIVYKPRPFQTFVFVAEAIECLKLNPPYRPHFPAMVARNTYGWTEWLVRPDNSSKEEIQNFFRNAGSLLFLAYIFQFNDGHSDNVLAFGSSSVIVDGESWFQNYSATTRSNGQYSVLDTYLIGNTSIQTPEETINSAYQARSRFEFKFSEVYAFHERSDRIKTGYGITKQVERLNLPVLNRQIADIRLHKDEFIEGFLEFSKVVKAKRSLLLNNRLLWQWIAQSVVRFVVRPTRCYLYALRMTQRPECQRGEHETRQMLKSYFSQYLKEEPRVRALIEYEIRALMRGDVPIFYTVVGERHLFDGEGNCYRNFFPESALCQVRRNIAEQPNVSKQIEIILETLT